jgi:hypothetical protein
MASWSWRKWPDVLVDFGRELYVPWRLAEGDVLYRDVAWINGPLSAWWNALWFRVLGVGFDSLIAVNLILLALLTVLLYGLLARAADRVGATCACLVFVTLFAFAQFIFIGNYNWVAPYSHDLTHGVLLSLVGIACVARVARSGSSAWIAASGLLLGLVFLTKVEVFAAAAVGITGGIAVALRRQCHSAAGLAGAGSKFALAVVAPPLVALGLLATTLAPGQALASLVADWTALLDTRTAALPFYRSGSGLDDVVGNLGRILGCLAACLLALAPAALLAYTLPRAGDTRRPWLPAPVVGGLAFGLSAGALLLLSDWIPWRGAVRALPLVLLALAAGMAWRAWRGERESAPERGVLQLALILFAGGLLAKMALNTRLLQYGFALAMPATLVVVVALVSWLPAALDRAGRSGSVFRAGAVGVLSAFVIAYLGMMQTQLERKTVKLAAPPDTLWSDALRGRAIERALADLKTRLLPGQSLAVLPEGVMLNYLLRTPNPTPYVVFMPPELLMFGEERMLHGLQQHPPDVIALVHKDTREYGFPFFGRDYGRALQAWIDQHYSSVQLIGGPPLRRGTRFGIRILERHDDRH